MGNLIDRVTTGYVVDSLDFRIWPVFNSADVAIVTGVGCLMYIMLFLSETLPGGSPGRLEKEG
ncbi:Signal peptidase (SPase) II [Sporomusa acidovorans]|nr:signal peptidase II [Sporomusa acidovorans]OZC19133.1 lipoprotein signal peptidase [Sporomusa acidovorans DSM 3132]SDD68265.1 Signal peptidase (SPase) II [Sporomusa acidovorans]